MVYIPKQSELIDTTTLTFDPDPPEFDIEVNEETGMVVIKYGDVAIMATTIPNIQDHIDMVDDIFMFDELNS
jgi:hypothetical protein